jgi:ubiquinone/menaquinone biosynthesis C-methylase UbiE
LRSAAEASDFEFVATSDQKTTNAQKTSQVQADYDRVAGAYARHYCDELNHKPLDRQLLDRFGECVKGAGLICDLGCGPGHIARYLQGRGVPVCGMDLSPRMIEEARRLNPGVEFAQGNMLALPVDDETWAGIAAFYAIVNFPPSDLPQVMREMHRVLRPEGWLLMSFHIGDEIKHLDELLGCAASLDFYFFRIEQVTDSLRAAGFGIEEVVEREPNAPEVEYQSRRAYIFARKRGD